MTKMKGNEGVKYFFLNKNIHNSKYHIYIVKYMIINLSIVILFNIQYIEILLIKCIYCIGTMQVCCVRTLTSFGSESIRRTQTNWVLGQRGQVTYFPV